MAATCLTAAVVIGWQALPRPDDRPIDLAPLRLAGPGLALLGAALAIFAHRLGGRLPRDRWLVVAAVFVLITGAAAAAGILDAVRVQTELVNP